LQADSDPLIQVLPTTGVSVSVSFYNTAAHKLAAEHAIIRALLQVRPQQRKGCYTAATVDLMNAASMPAALVRLSCINSITQSNCCCSCGHIPSISYRCETQLYEKNHSEQLLLQL
jgi:hypothetical protein